MVTEKQHRASLFYIRRNYRLTGKKLTFILFLLCRFKREAFNVEKGRLPKQAQNRLIQSLRQPNSFSNNKIVGIEILNALKATDIETILSYTLDLNKKLLIPKTA